jgi:HEAT repeat protein
MGFPRHLALTAAFALLLLAPLGSVGAQSADGKAKALFADYQKLYGESGWKRADRRMAIIRSLGSLPSPEARGALRKILRVSKSADEQLLAVRSLASIADVESAEDLLATLGKREDPVRLVALSDGLALTQDDALRTWLAGEGLESAKGEVKVAVVRALGELGAAKAAGPLLALYEEKAGKRGEVDLVHEVVRALGGIGAAEATATLQAAAAHADWRVRLAAAEALPRVAGENEDAQGSLRALLADEEPVVRRTAARWIGEAKLEPLVPELIVLLEDPRLRNRKVAHDALVGIAGKDLGFPADGWRRWWQDRTAEGGTGGESISVAQYYGFRVFSDRILFIVDTSGSMSWPWRWGPKRIEYAREKLAEVLGQLSDDALFNIVAFSTRVHLWHRSGEQPAEEKNVDKALAWIEKRFEADGDTYTHDALEAAFGKNAHFDTVYLLSDGTPSHGEYVSPEGIVAQVRVWNRYRRVEINTIALTLENLDRGMPNFADNLPRMKSFMRELAVSTGGGTRAITNAPRREEK